MTIKLWQFFNDHHEESAGVKKATIASQIKEEQIKRKTEREEQRDKHFEKLIVDFTEVK